MRLMKDGACFSLFSETRALRNHIPHSLSRKMETLQKNHLSIVFSTLSFFILLGFHDTDQIQLIREPSGLWASTQAESPSVVMLIPHHPLSA